ncbi:MAG TPA: hypothetical protein VGM41_02565 [Chitinophagaceae bacterium]|jgi:hypothetical protein
MAKQAGPIILKRTIDNLCFYVQEGIALLRKKPELSRKQMLRDKRYRRTMESAGRMQCAAPVAARIYAALPESWKGPGMYRIMVSEALGLLKAGKTGDRAYMVLWQRYLAEFEPGYQEQEAFVHKEVLKSKQVGVQGHKIDKKPVRKIKTRVERRQPENQEFNRTEKRYHATMDG